MPERRAATESVLEWALEEGFDRAGVARLGPSDHAEALRAWLARGDHAAMGWIERRQEPRLDPTRLLDGARSAVCVALQYHPIETDEAEDEHDLWSFVARYARGEDYHLVMDEGLRRLAGRIETAFPGARSRPYVDTGPILERELAARAGLGAFGKNTQLLHPEAGSWFLLGELLLTLDLEPGRPWEDLCGSCTACLDACPTGALPEAYRLDARRCISYWTIEHRGDIPEPMRDQLGGWVFGCDICQEVCPVNRRPTPAAEPRLRLPPERAALDLESLATLSREEYVERFRRSPMKRAKLEGLKRNAALAMGERGGASRAAVLATMLATEPDATVRSHVAWSLGRVGGEVARRALEGAAERESEGSVATAIRAALRRLGEPRSP